MTSQEPTGFLDRSLHFEGSEYRYQVYVPRHYDRSRDWPAILFLHGSGERGSDGLFSTAIGLGNAIRRDPDRYPAIVVFPQVPKGSSWSGRMERVALAALTRTIDEFSINRDRIALTGISMGGAGVWRLALHHPDRFQVIAPICGWVVPPATLPEFSEDLERLGLDADAPYDSLAKKLKSANIWIAHGAKDTTVPPSESRRMHEALERAGADVRYTEYPEAGHNAWDPSYMNDEFATFLSGRNSRSEP